MGITLLDSNTVVLVLIMLVSNFSMSISGNVKVGCIERERQALNAFKQSLTDPSNRLSSWVGQDCCSWRGVVCSNVTGHVVKLDISNYNPNYYHEADYKITSFIGKEVSPSLAELKHLTYLDLSWNNFSSSKIPSFFGNFKSLRYLDLSRASFAGVVPHSLGNLSNLEYLDISSNKFSSSKIPGFFGNFKSLRYLDLSRASFAGVVPPSLGNLSNLQVLNLGWLELLKIDHWNWLPQLSSLQFLDLTLVDLSQVSDLSRVLNSFPSLSMLVLEGCKLVEFPVSSLSYSNLTNIEILSLAENSFSGLIPSSFFINMPNLAWLHLDSNRLNGTIPESMGQLSNLEVLYLGNNLLSGTVSEIHFDKLSSLKAVHMSNFLAMNVSIDWIPPFQLEHLNMGSWEFVNGFPHWFQTQKHLTDLRIPNAKLSGSYTFAGILPFLPSTVEQLDLSNSSISGSIPPNIGDVMPNLKRLMLSHNNISGRIPTSLCGVRSLELLNFAYNHLSGDLPESCWSNLINMSILDLSSNHLTGSIPSSIGNWSFLISLHLGSNKFFGRLPMEMEWCKSLIVLDLPNNGFSGKLPAWIKKLLDLRVLNLVSNKFDGSLIHELCALSKLQTLNLAHNNFTGTIPSCFGNFSGMISGNNTRTSSYDRFGGYFDSLHQVIKGRELEYVNAQDLLVNLDLSSNNLEGHIPEELTFLLGLRYFNLSHNRLMGLMPEKIGNLVSLESLDFSHNHLTSMIPQSISEIYSLAILNLSYNNLSGRIPTGYQLQTLLDPSIYEGNQGLCGIQIKKKCVEDETFEFSDNNGKASKESETFWFHNALVVGIVIGFSGVCGVFFSTRT